MAKNNKSSKQNKVAVVVEKDGFNFRGKIKHLLTEENRPAIEVAFRSFMDTDYYNASNALVNMVLDEEAAERELQKLGLNFELVPFTDIVAFRNELRVQYELEHPDFLEVKLTGEPKKAYDELVKKTDVVVACVVYDFCQDSLGMEDFNVEKAICLLESEEEKKFCGGIGALGIWGKWRNFLKPAHKHIAALLKSMHEQKQEEEQRAKNLPFAGLSDKLEAAGVALSEAPVVDVPKEESKQVEEEEAPVPFVFGEPKATEKAASGYKKVTAMAVLENVVPFLYFVGGDYTSLLKLAELGFDLNEVMSKKDQIKNLIGAANEVDS